MPDQEARREALLDLIRLRKPIDVAVRSLAGYPWDSQGLVELRIADIENALSAYEAGLISEAGLEAWAKELEGRDDIDLEQQNESTLKEFLFEASTPEVNGQFDHSRLANWKERLGSTFDYVKAGTT
ncbi:MAG: hypothetical protein M1374_06870 [Firmicutes bacterium]|jgi:hypothetical protein|nr:hypothetical protein [Bacillota bacterium]